MADLTWSLERAAEFLGLSIVDTRGELAALAAESNAFSPCDVAAHSEAMRLRAWSARTDWSQSYQRQGFATLTGQVGATDVVEVLREIERFAKLDGLRDVVERVPGPAGRLVRINGLERMPAVLDVVAALDLPGVSGVLLDDPVMYRVSLVYRGDDNPPELGPHRDPRWTTRRFCSPVFALSVHSDTTHGEHGDVYVQPASHLPGPDGRAPAVERDPTKEVLPRLEVGDLMVHNLGVVHGADVYQRSRSRATLYCSFTAAAEIRS